MSEIVIVTGGSRGIGAATALLAARRGHALAVNFVRDEAASRAVVAKAREYGVAAIAVKADVSREDEVVRLFETVDAELGRVTLLVNNAGIIAQQTRVENMTSERLSRVFGTNVLGSFLCARQAVRRMSTRHGGSGGVIVNVSSAAARLGSPSEYVDYAASKGAIDTFTLGLAKEVAGEGIRVNAVRPGIIDTEIHASGGDPTRAERIGPTVPIARAGSPEEVAEAILWLASPEASYVSGAILDVAGGR